MYPPSERKNVSLRKHENKMKRMTAIESIEAGTDLLAGYDLIGNFRSLFKSPLPLPGSLFLFFLTQYNIKIRCLCH